MKKSCKTIICLLLVAVLALGAIVSVSASELPLYGDVDKDGTITVADATEVGKYLAELTAFDDAQLKVADYNGDGKINIEDATNIQKKLASIDYKYAHELYEVEHTKFTTDELTPLDTRVDKELNAIRYYSSNYPKFYNVMDNGEDEIITLFKTYGEYSRFFEETFEEYNEEFFEEHSLIYIYEWYTTGDIEEFFNSAYVKDDVLYIKMKGTAPNDGMETPDLGTWNHFIVVDKASVESINKICVNFEFTYYSRF
jgi:alpha-amylase